MKFTTNMNEVEGVEATKELRVYFSDGRFGFDFIRAIDKDHAWIYRFYVNFKRLKMHCGRELWCQHYHELAMHECGKDYIREDWLKKY